MELSGLGDKTRQLSVNYTTLSTRAHARRVLDNPNDELSLASLYDRLKSMAGPNQKYIFCRAASKKRIKEFEAQGHPDARMDPNRRVGKGKIGKVRYQKKG